MWICGGIEVSCRAITGVTALRSHRDSSDLRGDFFHVGLVRGGGGPGVNAKFGGQLPDSFHIGQITPRMSIVLIGSK